MEQTPLDLIKDLAKAINKITLDIKTNKTSINAEQLKELREFDFKSVDKIIEENHINKENCINHVPIETKNGDICVICHKPC